MDGETTAQSGPGYAAPAPAFSFADKPASTERCLVCGELARRRARESMQARLLAMVEDERRRIALDLHDGLGQSLSLLKLSLESASRLLSTGAVAEAGDSLQRLLPRVSEAVADVRRVAMELRPAMLDDLGILPTLSWFFREFEAVCDGIAVDKSFDLCGHDVPLALRITVYRIVQEATHNIVKHARASRVLVRLARVDDALQLRIEDNGRGFDPASVAYVEGETRGLGLLSMKERAVLSGGSYHLRSAPGQGTCVSVSWQCGRLQV